jgi:hypothetical protein
MKRNRSSVDKSPPKTIRRRKEESDDVYHQRYIKYLSELRQYEESVPLETLNITALKRICDRDGLIASGTKEHIMKRIRDAESGTFVAESRKKHIYKESKPFVPVVTTNILTIIYEPGENKWVENIPKPIWSNHIIDFLPDIESIYNMRMCCKYFYVIYTPILQKRIQNVFGTTDIKVWSLSVEAEKNKSLAFSLSTIAKGFGTKYSTVNIQFAIRECGSVQGIVLKLKSLQKNKEALKVRKQEIEQERQERLKQVNEAFRRIGAREFTGISCDPKVADYLRFLTTQGIYYHDYQIKNYVRDGSYAHLAVNALSWFKDDGTVLFSEQYNKYLADFRAVPGSIEKEKLLNWKFRLLYEEFQKTGIIPKFEELNF